MCNSFIQRKLLRFPINYLLSKITAHIYVYRVRKHNEYKNQSEGFSKGFRVKLRRKSKYRDKEVRGGQI